MYNLSNYLKELILYHKCHKYTYETGKMHNRNPSNEVDPFDASPDQTCSPDKLTQLQYTLKNSGFYSLDQLIVVFYFSNGT